MADHRTSLDDLADPWADRRRARATADGLFPGRVYDELYPQSLTDVSDPPPGQVWLGVFGDVTVLVTRPEEASRLGDTPGGEAPVRLRLRRDPAGQALEYREDVGGSWPAAPVATDDEALRSLLGVALDDGRRPDDLPPVATRLYGFLLLPCAPDGAPVRDPALVTEAGMPVVALPPAAEVAARLRAAPEGGFGRRTVDRPDRVRVQTAGGDVIDLHLPPDGTALLLGRNDDDTSTYFRGSAQYFEEPETDLLAGAPPWWDELLQRFHDGLRGPEVEARTEWVTFVHGWDGARWTKAVGAPDGRQAAWILDALRAP